MGGFGEQARFAWDNFVHSFLKSSGPFFTKDQYPDLSGQTWLVTGATGGIGLALAKIMVAQNAHVWIVGRSAAKLEAAVAQLQREKPGAQVDYALVDYNDLASVKPGVEKILRQTAQLNGIIHNAGVMHLPKGSRTKQGYEQHLGVNNLATQLMQDLLDPLIENTPNGRIVWVSSSAHTMAPTNGFDFAKKDLGPWEFYGQTKALNIIQAVQWSKKHAASPVKSLSAHPGAIKTDITRSTPKAQRVLISLVQNDVEHGTYAPIFAALSPNAVNNDYIVPWGRPGLVRPDIYRAARNELGRRADQWIEEQIAPFK